MKAATANSPAMDPLRKNRGPLRLTRRGRVVIFLAATAAVATSGFLTSTAVAQQPDPAIEVTVATVAPGETLWHFARGIAQPGQDLRDVVAEIQDLNDLSSAALQSGQQLLLPAY